MLHHTGEHVYIGLLYNMRALPQLGITIWLTQSIRDG